jgi:Xaa-Pro aminopeptidase
MGFLTNDPDTVARAAGFDSWYNSLPAHLSLDGFRTELPLVHVPNEGKATVMMKEIDRTNVELGVGADVNVIFHSPYFTFDAISEPSDAVPDVIAAAELVVSNSDLIDDRLPVELHDRLRLELGLATEKGAHFMVPGYHYTLSRADVAGSFARGFQPAIAPARDRIRALGASEALAPFLEGEGDDSFGPLDSMLEEAGVEVLVVSSPLNIQELTGFPMGLLGAGVWAVVERGSNEVHVLSHRELPWFQPGANRFESDLANRFSRGHAIGYEELDLSLAALRGFGIERASAAPVSGLLRRWRERRSWRDVPFYVLASDITLRGLEAALGQLADALNQGTQMSELDVYRRYRETVGTIIEDEGLPLRVETYFTHTHAGSRSLLPARATDFSVRDQMSLKMDAGLLVYDEFGLYRAVSDITRSVVVGEEALWFYDLLDDALVSGVVAECRPGRTGEEVFRRGMVCLEPHRKEIVAAGFVPDGVSLTDSFKRDVGHLLGKEEPATVGLRLGNHQTLEPGMVGAAEFQWPFRDHVIGVEDLFLVTEGEPVNLTRRQ